MNYSTLHAIPSCAQKKKALKLLLATHPFILLHLWIITGERYLGETYEVETPVQNNNFMFLFMKTKLGHPYSFPNHHIQ